MDLLQMLQYFLEPISKRELDPENASSYYCFIKKKKKWFQLKLLHALELILNWELDPEKLFQIYNYNRTF